MALFYQIPLQIARLYVGFKKSNALKSITFQGVVHFLITGVLHFKQISPAKLHASCARGICHTKLFIKTSGSQIIRQRPNNPSNITLLLQRVFCRQKQLPSNPQIPAIRQNVN